MARLRAEFSAQLMEVVQVASREELQSRRAKSAKSAPPVATPTPAPAVPVVARRKPGRPRKVVAAAAPPSPKLSSAMLAASERYFGECGKKGATATLLASFLAEEGMPTEADVIGELVKRGAIRDAGFRRSTGVGNKTAPVFVKN